MLKNTSVLAALAAFFLIEGQAAAQATGVAEVKTGAATLGTPLWRGLTAGIDAESVVAKLRELPEVKEAEVRQKKGRPPEIKVKYNPGDLEVFGFHFRANFIFDDDGLRMVQLATSDVCSGVAFQSHIADLAKGLAEKYPTSLKIVDSYGAQVKNKMGFTDGATQLQLTLEASVPPSEYSVARAKLDAALAEAQKSYDAFSKRLVASRLEMTRNFAVSSCPGSEGEQRSITLLYSSRAESIDQAHQSQILKEEKRLQDNSKL